MNQNYIRNFAIIAHVDHGKSTLADRLLEYTNTVSKANNQMLDSNPIEQERGITIKLAPVKMSYNLNGVTYILNLIDTPGHVDFSYEVSRALAACEGAILLIDATKGVQAQTLAHYREAINQNLAIIPVINKVDLPTSDVDNTIIQINEILNLDEWDILSISAKEGKNIDLVLKAIIEKIPPPFGTSTDSTRALVFNSDYLPHQGVRAWIRVVDGQIKGKDQVVLLSNNTSLSLSEIGVFNPLPKQIDVINTGEVGYVITNLKDPRLIQIGDTMIHTQDRSKISKDNALPGYNPPLPMVFVSFYPIESGNFAELTFALDKLRLSDSSLIYTTESSLLLGHGYRVGFLGLLHAEIVQERLEREFNLSVISTSPTVKYQVKLTNQTIIEIDSPNDLPPSGEYLEIYEPILDMTIFTPFNYVSAIIDLVNSKRGQLLNTASAGTQVKLQFELPLSEMVGEFYSKLKSISSGYASVDYEFSRFQSSNLIKLDFLLAGDLIPVLSQIVPKEQVDMIGRKIVDKLALLIPRHQFEIAIQAVIGGKIIARSTVKPFRKDVTAKLYGGDQTRKDKLLEKQKKGKKKMKQIGRVTVEPDTFLKLMS